MLWLWLTQRGGQKQKLVTVWNILAKWQGVLARFAQTPESSTKTENKLEGEVSFAFSLATRFLEGFLNTSLALAIWRSFSSVTRFSNFHAEKVIQRQASHCFLYQFFLGRRQGGTFSVTAASVTAASITAAIRLWGIIARKHDSSNCSKSLRNWELNFCGRSNL